MNLSEPMPETPVETQQGLDSEQSRRVSALNLARPLLARPLVAPPVEDLVRLADWILTGSPRQRTYPFTEGNVQVLGPSVIATDNGAVINWLGVNYLPDEEDTQDEDDQIGGTDA